MVQGIDPKKIQALIDSGDTTWEVRKSREGKDVYVKIDKEKDIFVMVDPDSSRVVVQTDVSLPFGRTNVRFYDQAGDVGLGEGDRVGITLSGRGILGLGKTGGNEIPHDLYQFDIVSGALQVVPGQLDQEDAQILQDVVRNTVNVASLSAAYLSALDEAEVPRAEDSKVAKK